MPIDKETFRRAMGSFAAGVTVVTTADGAGRPYGLTATAFSSVSLLPPLALVCIGKDAASYQQFTTSATFAVNFLAADQVDMSNRFASSGGNKFDGVDWRLGQLGAPLLSGTLGYAECRVVNAYDGGDHTIFVGEIGAAEISAGEPLIYFRSAYRKLAD